MLILTVRHRILTEMAAALAAMTVPSTDTGVIVLEVDQAAAQQASGSPEWVQVISQAVKAGKMAIEIDAGPDAAAGGGTQGGESRSMIDRWSFVVVLACHLPDSLPEDGDPKVPISPERMADVASAAIYRLCGTLFPVEGLVPQQCGRWYNLVTKQEGEPDNMPLAIRTDVVQKGAVGLSGYAGTRVTMVVLEIHYRTQAGRPEVVA